MKLVTRYVVREHVGPLVFALSALTSLLMLQYVARQLANLAGKGLPWTAIAQFFLLSLPFTIAMTLPMAVLVATLFAFGRMAAENEITAFKANGVRVRTLMIPVLFCALLISAAMVVFNDQVLPRANHRLRILQQDIARTKPTLALRDQALNALTDQFYMRVDRSDAETNRMWGVSIYDLSKGAERQTVYADSGLFMLAPNGKDLQLKLFDGHSQEFVKGDARRLQRSFFRQQIVQVRGISQGFESSRSDTYKGDREMSICEMQRKYHVSALEFKRLRDEYIEFSARLAPKGTKELVVPRGRPMQDGLAYLYCVTVPGLFAPKTAAAQPPAGQPPVGQPPAGQPPAGQPPVKQPSVRQLPIPQPPIQQPPVTGQPPAQQQPVQPPVPQVASPVSQPGVVPGQPVVAPQAQPPVQPPRQNLDSIPGVIPGQITPAAVPVPMPGSALVPVPDTTPPAPAVIDTVAMMRGSMLAAQTQMTESRESLDSLAVEIHKKFALSFACFVFVLFGPPIALRFPRGGVGVTIGVSIVVFGLYYICLMGGEALADKGKLPAMVAMWIANVIFTLAGVVLLWRIESTTDGSRGGGLREWWGDRAARRQLARERTARLKAPVSSAVGA